MYSFGEVGQLLNEAGLLPVVDWRHAYLEEIVEELKQHGMEGFMLYVYYNLEDQYVMSAELRGNSSWIHMFMAAQGDVRISFVRIPEECTISADGVWTVYNSNSREDLIELLRTEMREDEFITGPEAALTAAIIAHLSRAENLRGFQCI